MTQDRAQLLITAVDQTRSAFDSIRGNLAKLGDESNRVRGLLAGLGVSLSVAGFATMIKSAIDAADQLNKLSQKIGISVEALSTLRFAAQLSDVSLETLQKGIKGLSQNIAEANTGVGDGAQVFEALGVSVKNADGSMKSTEAVLLQVADVFANLEDGAVKTALAVKLFGKAGQDMIPFLNQGAAGISQLTAEAERLGLKLTTETARSAEAFNDNLTALKASSSSLGIALARDFLPELTNITNAMREAANEAGTLKALWVGLGGVGNLVFNGTEIKRARDEVARIQELVDSTRKKVESGRAPVPFMPFDVKFNEAAMATLKKNLAQWEQELAVAKQRLDALMSPKRPEEKTPTGKPTEDMQRIACVVSGGQWVNGKCEKKSAGSAEKDTTGAQTALLKAQLDAEFALLKDGLTRQQTALDAALEDRLVSVRDYHTQKTAIEQREIDAEIARKQQELARNQQVARTGKSENDRLRAKAEVAKAESDLISLNNRRADIEQANARKAAQAERELADALAQAREELAQITGTATDADRQAAIARSYRDLRARLMAEGDAGGVSLVDRLIDVKAAQANLAAVESLWRQVTERLRNAQEAIQIQQQAGLLTEAQARQQIVALQQQSAAEMERLLPTMQQAAQAIGPDAVIRVQSWRNELERTRLVVDEMAPLWNRIGEAFGGALNGILTGTQTWRNAMSALFLQVANAFLQQIVIQPFQQWVAMQARMLALKLGFIQQEQTADTAASVAKVAQKSSETTAVVSMDAAKAGAGAAASQASIPYVGPALAVAAMVAMVAAVMSLLGKVKKFAGGGLVSGPGTSTSDSIPARLSAGEYVLRAEVVRRVGVDFLHALNGGLSGPRWSGPRLAFADGGVVPEIAPAPAAAPSQAVRIVNVIDPDMAADYLNSAAGEKTILNVLSRNGSAVRELLR